MDESKGSSKFGGTSTGLEDPYVVGTGFESLGRRRRSWKLYVDSVDKTRVPVDKTAGSGVVWRDIR